MSQRLAVWSDWGTVEYTESHKRQLHLLGSIQSKDRVDTIVTVEHPHVITVGRRKDSQANILSADNVPIVHVERGGDVTYHGPGQLIVYPLIKLAEDEQDLHAFLRNLEEAVICILSRWNITATRVPGKTGVWAKGKKLASIGIACRKWVTFHGLALNVNTDMSYFHKINPCGFQANIMGSMQSLLGAPIPMDEVKECLVESLVNTLGRELKTS